MQLTEGKAAGSQCGLWALAALASNFLGQQVIGVEKHHADFGGVIDFGWF